MSAPVSDSAPEDAADSPTAEAAPATVVDEAPLQARVLAWVRQRAEEGSVRVTVARLASELQTQGEAVRTHLRALTEAGQLAITTAGRQGLHIRLGGGSSARTPRPAARTGRRYCPFCGQASTPAWRFCGGCGQELPR